MATILDVFNKMLISNGMNETQSSEVLELVKTNQLTNIVKKDDYNINFEDDESAYPKVIYSILYESNVKPVALIWINQNKPLAWFKPMFEKL